MAIYTKIPKPASRIEWLKLRRRGIGGSDAPAIILSPEVYKWKQPVDVYKSKTSETEETTSLACRVGTELEGFVAELFTEETGLKTRNCNYTLINKEYPFMMGNIDRKIESRNWGLECKTTSAYNKNKFTDDAFPYEYYVQMQHYMGVTGWEKWYLACLIGNFKFVWYEVKRSEEDIAAIVKAEREFWELVETKNNIWEAI